MIKIYEPNIIKYKESALDAINNGWVSNHGEYIEKANNLLNEVLNCKYSILMSNGTCATHCLFLSLKYKYPKIKKIYMPNNVYIATWNCALMVYSIENLELMKTDINTWNINTEENYIKTLEIDSAILIVHNLGNIINVPRLKRIRPDIVIIEDNCEGLFGKYEDNYSGSSKNTLCSSISFYGNKIITTGEGGAFITNNEDIYNYIKKVYSQGMSNIKYLHELHAYNYRMTNIQAAFLYDQLKDIDNILNNKKLIFEKYKKLLDPLIKNNNIILYKQESDTKSADWIFSVRIIDNKKTIEETTQFFNDNDVDIRPFFYPINYHTHFLFLDNNDSVSYILNKEVIMIPSSPTITEEEQEKIVDTIYKFILYINNIGIINIQETQNTEILDKFISTIENKYFRYFKNRTSSIIKNHILTFLFYDIEDNDKKCFGYTHIDYYNKYWFGIYLNENYRSKNKGKLLLNYTINHYKLKNINEIHLSVDIENEIAIKLYKKNNFNIFEKKDNIYYMKKSML